MGAQGKLCITMLRNKLFTKMHEFLPLIKKKLKVSSLYNSIGSLHATASSNQGGGKLKLIYLN